MSNPFIPLATQALKANLSKNELRLFLALTIQTLGYHKDADPLTDKRIAKMTGVRVDHLRPCIERFLDYGLFERRPHPYYDYLYCICDDFLDDDKVYPPTLPRDRKTTAPSSVSLPNDGEANPPPLVSSPNDGEANPPPLVSSPNDGGANPPPLVSSPNDGGESPQRLGEFPSDGGHTTENPNNKKTLQQKTTTEKQTEKNVCQKKPQQQKKITTEKKAESAEPIITQAQPQPSVTISLSGNSLTEDLIIESSQPIRLQICAKKEKQVSNDVSDTPKKATTSSVSNDARASGTVFPRWHMGTSDMTDKSITYSFPHSSAYSFPRADVGMQSVTNQRCYNDTKAKPEDNKKPIADLAASVATSLVKPTDSIVDNEKPFVVVNEKEEEKTAEKAIATTTPKPTTRPLPKAIDKDDHRACNRYFQPLNEQQQKDVLTVFYHNLKTSKINSKVGYFISLCQKAKSPRGLTVPHEAIVKKDLTPEQLAINKKANADREQRMILWSDYQGLKNQAALLNKSEAETAQLLGFEEAYAVFGQQVAEV